MIYVNGDSWTEGYPFSMDISKKNLTWPRLLSKKLKKPIFDDSMSGASNSRIFRRTSSNIILKDVKLAIIFLTHWSRVETGNPNWKNVNGYATRFVESQQLLIGSDFHDYYFEKYFESLFQYEIFLHGIINLQSLAEKYKTKLYFLDTFAKNLYKNINFDIFCEEIDFENSTIRKNYKDEFIKKYELIKNLTLHIDFSKFISDKSYQELIGDVHLEKGHPLEEGHTIISNIVYDFIKNTV